MAANRNVDKLTDVVAAAASPDKKSPGDVLRELDELKNPSGGGATTEQPEQPPDTEPKKQIKRYYWVRQQKGFFDQTHIRRLMSQENGHVLVIVYQKMLLYSIGDGDDNDGLIIFRHFEASIAEEIAYSIQESPKDVETVIGIITKYGFMEQIDIDTFVLKEAVDNVGKEGDSAERKRRYDKRKKQYEKETVTK